MKCSPPLLATTPCKFLMDVMAPSTSTDTTDTKKYSTILSSTSSCTMVREYLWFYKICKTVPKVFSTQFDTGEDTSAQEAFRVKAENAFANALMLETKVFQSNASYALELLYSDDYL